VKDSPFIGLFRECRRIRAGAAARPRTGRRRRPPKR